MTSELKAISTGDGTDTILQLSDSTIQVNGDLNVGSVHKIYQDTNTLNIVGNSDSTSLKYFTNFGNNNTNQFGLNNFFRYPVGIGFTSTQGSAMLNVKGSGTTSATTSLLVQNSAGDDSLKITDDNKVLIGNSTTGGIHNVDSASSLPFTVSRLGIVRFSVSSDSGNGQIVLKSNTNNEFSVGTNGNIFQINDGANTNQGSKRFSIIQDGNVGIGDVTPTARLHVKGSGNDNTTTSLLVQNSAGTDLLNVTDDGFVNTRQTLIVNHPTNSSRSLRLGWGSLYATDDNSELSIGAVYSQNTAPTIVLGGKTRTGGADAVLVQALNGMYLSTTVSTEDPSAQLHIKGSGTTSATTSLLVQNSAGTEHLKVTDDGVTNVRGDLVVNHPSVSSRFIGLSWGAIGANSTNDELSLYGGGSTNGSVVFLNASGKTAAPAAIGMKTNGMLVASAMVQSSFAPDASAQLQVDSTTKGFLPPRMTSGEKNAITSPALGLMVYDTDANQMSYWNGGGWINFY